jgi:polysaccharide export outer membrane protein
MKAGEGLAMRLWLSMFLMAGLVTGVAAAKSETRAPQDKKEEAQDTKSEPPATTVRKTLEDTAYKIGLEDVLQIDVWKEPEITRTVPVRPDGKITLPLLNDVQAAGLTPMELAGVIREGLKKYINEPQVTVSISAINSRRVYVTGEVTKPGAFALLPGMTVLQALTSAGGLTQFAKTKSIYVLRTEDGKQVKHSFNYKDVVSGKKPEDNIQLRAGDTIVVP